MSNLKTQISNLLYIFLTSSIYISGTRCAILEICSQCTAVPKADSFLVQYCKNASGHIQKSCCMNATDASGNTQIIGIDLSGCGLKNVNGLFTHLKDLQVIMLDNNTDLKVGADDFSGLKKLEYLSLPESAQCPGGIKSWASIDKLKNLVICHEEINLCQHNNVTCQNNNSQCELIGPGRMECLCRPGYHGYKCLRQGNFPGLSYTLTLCGCTVVISGFLWCTQRRKVKKKTHTY